MKFNILKEEEMLAAGFTKTKKGYYLCKKVAEDITLNIQLEDDSYKIDVLDESFLQPYDYQFILSVYPEFMFAKKVKASVENILCELQNKKILENYTKGQYI